MELKNLFESDNVRIIGSSNKRMLTVIPFPLEFICYENYQFYLKPTVSVS